jgi:uracil-DNA glycosylase family 4
MTFYFPLPERVTKSKIVYDCDKCGLYKNERIINPKFEPIVPDKYSGLVIVASKVTIEDDRKKTPLINGAAKIIRSTFLKNKVNIINEVAVVYALQCGSRNKGTTDVQFKCCANRMIPQLKDLKPKLIITLGDMAFKYVMGLKNKYGITKIRNRIVPNFELNCLVFPIFDPNVLHGYHYKFAIERDLKRILKLWKLNYRKRTYINNLLNKRKILEGITINEVKETEIDSSFAEIHQLKEVSLDYETTNANPYDSSFEITHISFSTKSYAWVFHESLWENNESIWETIKTHMKIILTNPNILKIIQNAKFEDQASRYIFGIKKLVNSYCTMLATHVVDERRGCTSLDFQNLTRFGIPPYSETVKPHLIPKTKDHKVNTIRKAPHDDLILYAGLDVITTYNNYLVLSQEILPNAYPEAVENHRFLEQGHWVFANMSQRGIPIGQEEYSELDELLDNAINDTLTQISEIPEFIEYNEYLKSRTIKTKEDQVVEDLILSTKRKVAQIDKKPKRLQIKNSGINRKISFN